MLSREEVKQKNILFWTEFKDYMKKIKSSNGRRINWVSYPTDVKDIYLRLIVNNKGVGVYFDIQPKDEGVRSIIWEQMTELKKVLENEMNYPTQWSEEIILPDGRRISRIFWEDTSFNFYKEEDKLKIFEFLKDRLMEFDRFYQEFKDILINLVH